MGWECSKDLRRLPEGSLRVKKSRPKCWRAKCGRIELNFTIRKTDRQTQDIGMSGRREQERLWPAKRAEEPDDYVALCYVMLCYVMLCYVMLCYVVLCCVVLCCVALR